MEQHEIDHFGRLIAEGADRQRLATQHRDETNKPPMPAHDYAVVWARDTLSGKERGEFDWGDRNIARAYLDYRAQRDGMHAALKSARAFVKAELDVRVDGHTLSGAPETDDGIRAEAMRMLEQIDAALAKAEGRQHP